MADSIKSLEEVKRRVLSLNSKIRASRDLLPSFGASEDFAKPHVEINEGGYHWVITERGKETERKSTGELSLFLYWIFESVTFQMAIAWELSHRADGIDSRRLLFSQQMHLLSRLDVAWLPRWATDIGRTLERHPFSDSPEK